MFQTLNELRKDMLVVAFFAIMFYLALSCFMYFKIKLYEETHPPVYQKATFAVTTI